MLAPRVCTVEHSLMNRLSALQAYTRLVELESFSGVAAELRVKQSTVSKWIAALEEHLGVRLIDRTTRSLRVTDAGRRFYQRATVILSDYEAAVAEAREEATALRGRIRLNVPVVFGQRFIVPAVTDFLLEHEAVELELVFGDRYTNLVDEGYDVAIRVGLQLDSTLQSHALGDGRRHLVAAPAYLAKWGSPHKPKELEGHQCLVHTEGRTRAAWTFARGKRVHRVSVGGRVTANHSEATLHMTKSGMGIALLANWLVAPDLACGALVTVLDAYQPPSAPVRALTPPGRKVAPRIRALIDHLRLALAPALSSR